MFKKPFKPTYYVKPDIDEPISDNVQTRASTATKVVRSVGIKPVPDRERKLPETTPVRISRRLGNNHKQQPQPYIEEIIPPLHLFFHIWITGDWKQVAQKIWNRIVTSGLVDKLESINISILGGSEVHVQDIFGEYSVNYILVTSNQKLYERGILNYIGKYSKNHDGYYLYINTFGVNKSKFIGVKDWQEMLIYFTIDKWSVCVKKLFEHDALGVNLKKMDESQLKQITTTDLDQTWYFSGNFWWARSEHLKKLTNVGNRFLDPTIWISNCKNKNLYSIWTTNIDHFNQLYPSDNYQ